MKHSTTVSITPDPGQIRSHIYDDDGGAYLSLSGYVVGFDVNLWVGREGADLKAESEGLRKLARLATELADHLDRRAAAELEQRQQAGDGGR